MKKLMLILCLLLCGCSREPVKQTPHSFSLAVIDTAASGSLITFYDENHQPLGQESLSGKYFKDQSSGYSSETVIHDGYAYILPLRDHPQKMNEYGIVKLSLNDGTYEIIETEVFENNHLYASDEQLVLVQHSPDFTWWRTCISFDTGESTLEKMPIRSPDLYYPLTDGWIHLITAPGIRLVHENNMFEQMNESVLSESSGIGSFTAMRPNSAYSALMNGILYVPGSAEILTLPEDTSDEEYENVQFAGYEFSLMKIDPETLAYESVSHDNRMLDQLLKLDETRLIMTSYKQTMTSHEEGNETHYSYSENDRRLTIFDTETEQFTDIDTDFNITMFCLSMNCIYAMDDQNVIHILDPESFDEIGSFRHETAEQNQPCMLIPAR